MKKYIFLLTVCMLSVFTYGQDLKQWLESNDKYVPVSPNAASLGMYGSIPVGHYTGIPNINIPLYEINLDGKKFPISLSYHASGIKVAQDASWVGLGWALNIGGTITRQVMGWDDFNQSEGGYYFDDRLPMDIDEISELSATKLQSDAYRNWNYYLENIRDPEPDLFQFNFGNHSGSFYFDKNGKNGNTYSEAKAELINKNEYLNIAFKVSDKTGVFTITDGDGFKYYFGTTEKSKMLSASSSSFVASYNNLSYTERRKQPEVVTSWMLDSIVSPNNNKISFEYEFERIFTIPTMSEDVAVMYELIQAQPGASLPSKIQYYGYGKSEINQAILRKITFSGGTVVLTSSERSDLQGNASKLDELSIKNYNSDVIKAYKFNYDYTGSENITYNSSRLMLDSLVENNGNKTHKFTYNKGQLPEKTSIKTDIWGYYSEAPDSPLKTSDNTYFVSIPSSYIDMGSGSKLMMGNDRYPIEKNMKSLILEKIEYPTGGYTSFEYEGHKAVHASPDLYRFEIKTVGSLRLTHPDLVIGIDKLISDEFIIEEKTLTSVNAEFRRPDINRNGGVTSNIVVDRYDEITKEWSVFSNPINFSGLFQGNSLVWTDEKQIFLDKGKYRTRLKLDETANYHYQVMSDLFAIQKIYYNKSGEEQVMGGLRIKKTIDSDGFGNNITKEYKYEKDNTTTGLLLVAPTFLWQEQKETIVRHVDGANWYEDYTTGLFQRAVSFPRSTFRYPSSSNTIAYSYVEEVTDNGKTIFEFQNQPDIIMGYKYPMSNFPSYSEPGNGLPTSTAFINKEGKTVSQTVYQYKSDGFTGIKGMQFYTNNNVDNGNILFASIRFYNLKPHRIYLTKETTTTYESNGENTLVKEYIYNPTNFLPTSIQSYDSKNILLEQRTKYPVDYTSGMPLDMIKKHMVNQPIEQLSLYDGKVTGATKLDFFKVGESIQPNIVYSLACLTPVEESTYSQNYIKRNTFHVYDNFGNPIYLTKDDISKVVYLWGYNGQYPIAEIKNATYEQVSSALGSQTPESLSSSLEPNMDLINGLRVELPQAQVTTYTYYPLIGMKTVTDPKGLTSYYEYDSFGRLANIRIDDLGTKNLLESYHYNYVGNGNTIPNDVPSVEPVDPDPTPSLTPDPYKKGKASTVLINIGAKGEGSYGLTGWNYDTQKVEVSNVITKTYKTIEASEYQWTTENLRLKYGTYGANINMTWLNLTQADVDKYANEYLNGQKIPLEEFEQIFGTWVTLYPTAMMYRKIEWGVPTGPGTFDKTWGIPTKEDIWQLYGQAPRTTGNVYEDIKDFLFASACDNKYGWTQNMFNRRNISGLTLTPLGMRESNQGGAIYGFGQVASLQTIVDASIETLSDRDLSGNSGIISSGYSYHLTQARHRRPMTDQELGYKMYIDAANDQILMLAYNQASSLPELAKGLERGIALRYANREHLKVLKKWSEIQAEAKEIKSKLAPTNYPAPPALLPCEKEPEPEITADPYTKGKESEVLINIGAKGDGSYGLTGWNYDSKKVELSNVITKTYKTIEAGEYQWTTENLRLKYGVYGSVNMNWVNFTQADVDKYSADYLSGKSVPLDEFEQVYGTWATLYDVAMMYRNIYWGVPTGPGTFDHTWGIPTKEDIWQMYGQAPRISDNLYNDIKDFLFASSSDFNFSWTQGLFNNKNTSGMTLTPLGMRESYNGGAIYGFGQVTSLQTSTWKGIETLSDRDLSGQSGLISNNNSYHFTQARHRRPLTDQELGYKMYIDAANDQVLMLPYDQISTLPELPKGLERGVALRYANRKAMKVVKKWSEIQAEAAIISSKITKAS